MMFDLTRWPIRGPISMSEDNWRELRQEVERLREVERKALEQSEYIQKHGLTEWDMALKNAEIERLRYLLANADALIEKLEPVSFKDRQPDDFQVVLAYMPLPGYGWMRVMFRQGVAHPYTHWLPLPDDPQAALGAEGGDHGRLS